MDSLKTLQKKNRRNQSLIVWMLIAVLAMGLLCLFVGVSNMGFSDGVNVLLGGGTNAQKRILLNIRLPRVLAAIIAGAGLSVAGLMMQTCLSNAMASPSTLGVSNGAVFGANLSIIAFAGGFLSTGNNLSAFDVGANPYATSALAFVFATASVLLILGLCTVRSFSPNVVVLSGMAIGAVWTALTTILQFYATDVGLSAAVVWSFGDLGRATYETDILMAVAVSVGFVFFYTMRWKYNALLAGEATAKTMGVNVSGLRFVTLLLSSVITAVCVSFLGVIGFVGIICPHVTKKLLGHDHRFTLPVSCLMGSLLLLLADTASRSLGGGSALPVGAITSLLGAPFFIAIIFGKKEGHHH
ncbi:MAG: iron ABC transporter permease [Oscillospiraceae bacterium]|nr:iron ABC transporter permease [Oscillospiraceae bacterium]